jgi:2-polyprenyl-3-methyl-5-hydroxy-6-metoxy-1,4-benzoquinol methylase
MMRGLKPNNPNFLFPTEVFAYTGNEPYIANSYPVAADFYHPEFSAFLARLNNHPFQIHRKLWEFAYIEHRLTKAEMIKPGKYGVCFGVGQEQLPAMFASRGCKILATDAPPEIIGEIWSKSNEFSKDSSHLNYRGIIEEHSFNKLVTYETCNMNELGSHLRDFDFCWSACCLEHLGSLKHGIDFIINSLDTLKPGGIACHTTELNLSSNTETIEKGGTVLYRRKDLEALQDHVRDLGHEIESLEIPAPATPIDHHVDVPPYEHNPHLKLLLQGFVTTSVGITIKKKGSKRARIKR